MPNGLTSASQLIQRNVHLEDLNLSHNKINHASVFDICNMLQENSTLTRLALAGNRLTDESIKVCRSSDGQCARLWFLLTHTRAHTHTHTMLSVSVRVIDHYIGSCRQLFVATLGY
jgi:hypothetical protein